jgi:hypothetical protein
LPDGNYLFAEPLIVARLREKMPDVHVAGIGESDELSLTKHRFPGIYVLFAGDEVTGAAGRGAASQAVQHWIVTAAAKSTDSLASGTKVREILGRLFCQALEALQGFEVAPGMTLVRTTCSVPVMYESGHAFLAAEYLLTVDIRGGN